MPSLLCIISICNKYEQVYTHEDVSLCDKLPGLIVELWNCGIFLDNGLIVEKLIIHRCAYELLSRSCMRPWTEELISNFTECIVCRYVKPRLTNFGKTKWVVARF